MCEIAAHFDPDARVVLYQGDRLDLLETLPIQSQKLIVTSPPYNMQRTYEEKRTTLEAYLAAQKQTIEACVRALAAEGSICWQIGNYVDAKREVYPLDVLLYPFFKECGLILRNRIVWHFEHGLHRTHSFSGRYETILWFTRQEKYTFNLDPVRIPQKYPGKKHYKGPKVGQYSSNPLGKNPGDVWIIPNVKHNHPEKTAHPCQFPIELIERLVLALTNPGDWVCDPYMGVGTVPIAALLHGRHGIGADIVPAYVSIARERVLAALQGRLRIRDRQQAVYTPTANTALTRRPNEFSAGA